MLKFTRITWVFSIVTIFLCSKLCLGLVSIHGEGMWPLDWPIELSPYRSQAKTLEIAAGNQENVYEIHFRDRKEFEKVWPTILKLKSKGAPLRLRSIEKPFDEKTSLFSKAEPIVRIYGPVHPAWPVTFRGGKKLRPAPPWPESIMLPTGELPEYVTISKDGTTWVPLLEKTKETGCMWRARIDIELVVDGKTIDLNRIRLPVDTTIIDKRAPVGQQQLLRNHTEWISECIKRTQSIKPGATRGKLLEVFTTEGGISTRSWRTYVYRECPYIKVDVEFKAVDDDNKWDEKPGDIVTKVSKPYLEWSIID